LSAKSEYFSLTARAMAPPTFRCLTTGVTDGHMMAAQLGRVKGAAAPGPDREKTSWK
jgi:hypothetical protein